MPAVKLDERLPLVQRVIANAKRFLLGTFHGVSSACLPEISSEHPFNARRRLNSAGVTSFHGLLRFRFPHSVFGGAVLPLIWMRTGLRRNAPVPRFPQGQDE